MLHTGMGYSMKLFSKRQTDHDLLLTIAQNQALLVKKLEAMEERLKKLDKKQTEGFGDMVRGLFILYGKAVMARLNFMELSEGRPISASENELNEIRNSMREEPDPNVLILPLQKEVQQKPTGDFKKKKISKLN